MAWLSGCIRSSVVLGLVFGACATACGSSDDNGSGVAFSPVSSGLPEDKKINELTPDEAQTLCKAYADRMESTFSDPAETEKMKRAGCTLLAVFTSPDIASCNARVDECAKMTEDGGEELTTTTSCDPQSGEMSTCSATIAELEACYGEAIAVAKSFYASISCENMINALQGKGGNFPMQSDAPSCTAIESRCPMAHKDDGF